MPKLVAIVNITPDSFSDGGHFMSAFVALDAIDKFIKQGADVIDIGAESTRHGATSLTHEEEWERLEPVMDGIAPYVKQVPVSIDTRHAQTAKKSLTYGVHWINDVSGFYNPAMVEAVKNSSCMLVVMHSLSVPADRTITMQCEDVVEELLAWGRERIAELEKNGIARSRIIFDPGIGFGKTAEQSRALIEGIARFKTLGVPILVGHSRKSFLGGEMQNRDEKTLQVSCYLAEQGVDYLRIHNIPKHKEAL